jgi:hypothetical protein
MSFDLRLSQNWEEQNYLVAKNLGFEDTQVQLSLYNGVGHAILDILYGLKEFWPMKKSLIVITDGDPYLLLCLRTFVREGYEITQLKSREILNVPEWISKLKSDVLAVIYSGDHAFTGELLMTQELSEKLSVKKICSIEIQHALHAYSKRTLFPWHVQIQHFFPDLAVAVNGARVRLFQHTAALLNWSRRDLITEIQHWQSTKKEDASIVKKFEAFFSTENQWGVKTYFEPQIENRLWDRAVLIVTNLGGDHFIHKLAEKLNIKLEKAGFSDFIETAHFCRWKVINEFTWWGREELKTDVFQSLIAISTDILAKEDFYNLFVQVLSACHKESELL